MGRQENANLRLETDKGFLICDFSVKRFNKDKSDMEKQIHNAKLALDNRRAVKRHKFLTMVQTEATLNQNLIEKTKLQLGIKYKK